MRHYAAKHLSLIHICLLTNSFCPREIAVTYISTNIIVCVSCTYALIYLCGIILFIYQLIYLVPDRGYVVRQMCFSQNNFIIFCVVMRYVCVFNILSIKLIYALTSVGVSP